MPTEKQCHFVRFCRRCLTRCLLTNQTLPTQNLETNILWIPTGGFLAHGRGPFFFFSKQKKNYMASISCSLRTQLSVQVAYYYRICFIISVQTLSLFFKNTIFSAVKKITQLQWLRVWWFHVRFQCKILHPVNMFRNNKIYINMYSLNSLCNSPNNVQEVQFLSILP